MYGTIILLHFLTKCGLVVVLCFGRFLQSRVIRIETSKLIGDVIVGALLCGVLFSIIESRVIMYIMVLMIISTATIVDHAIGQQMKLDVQKNTGKVAIAQISYLVELVALLLVYRAGYWGETETIVLRNLSQLF